MTREQLLTFGRAWHYPFLALPEAPLRHGKDAYEQATPEQLALASERIDRWNEIVTASQVDRAIGMVDAMLARRKGVESPISERNQSMGTATRGFASRSKEELVEISSRAGKKAHKLGLAHRWTSEEAAKAGSIGGKISKRPATSYNKRVPEGEQLV
jgi:uncharacterized protein